MRLRNFAASVAVLGLTIVPIAAQAADAVVGTVAADQGDVLVSRGGELLRATPSMSLYAGDRVMTRAGGTAKIALKSGCTQAVAPSSMATVGAAGCADMTGFDAGRAAYAGRSSAALEGGPSTAVLIALAVAAAGGAGYLAFGQGNNGNNSTTTSP